MDLQIAFKALHINDADDSIACALNLLDDDDDDPEVSVHISTILEHAMERDPDNEMLLHAYIKAQSTLISARKMVHLVQRLYNMNQDAATHHNLFVACWQAQHYDDMRQHILQYQHHHGQNTPELTDAAYFLMEAGFTTDAINLYQHLIKEEPYIPDHLSNLSLCYHLKGDLLRAAKYKQLATTI